MSRQEPITVTVSPAHESAQVWPWRVCSGYGDQGVPGLELPLLLSPKAQGDLLPRYADKYWGS